ncbi:hypothetical protein APD05_08345 [Acinetobacter nosocomialis]|uniref:Cap15 family cyclic dinucleotide receptor domain-containing protein n=1 Tax=Acinetobacter calcoaceticus/baumannii complex TaxID=909768 RepID=UPI00044AB2A3|nr:MULTISPECIES: hypothetical protein [Acinetobacter calcoaceticus/baumannii complex]EXI08889.1 putative transmembrane protein [Acinetobacter sp. 694762]KQD09928.1 hypothetical protein APD05_08345 [Acinetobacter nosocomialis]MCU4575571.1 hypothetical protein [Acinetobacter nosocomialis]MCU4594163.1 hypothetical protein [Acinetobacter nosocomialis]
MFSKGHEYTVQNGSNRSNIGKTIYAIAAFLAGGLSLVFIEYFAWFPNIPNFISTAILTALLFFVIYYSFNHWIWKVKYISKFLKFPNISGDWNCNGISSFEEFSWTAKIKITQTWDRLRIVFITENSSSESVSAAIIYDDIKGYTLVYNYRNQPDSLDDEHLKTHIGFVELKLDLDKNQAIGNYYNVSGRKTFGKFIWTR